MYIIMESREQRIKSESDFTLLWNIPHKAFKLEENARQYMNDGSIVSELFSFTKRPWKKSEESSEGKMIYISETGNAKMVYTLVNVDNGD